ncbi:MAG: hypothetical protein NTW29_06395 [Bacteroidetes bacterium]|nr:hypothetical protein [Bacteroidota bacterium]
MISSQFRKHVQAAIGLMANEWAKSSDEKLIELLQSRGMSQMEADELRLFMPVAFCRTLFKMVKWSDTYQVMNEDNTLTEKRFSETESYQIILEETIRYFQEPSEEQVLAIAGRSAELKVINDLLLKNPVLKIEDIILSKLVVVR